MVDIDETVSCPSGDRCESCSGTEDLVLVTLEVPIGVLCATLCEPCIEDERMPQMSWVQAAERVYQHVGEHLGISIDDAAELRQPSSGDGGLGL